MNTVRRIITKGSSFINSLGQVEHKKPFEFLTVERVELKALEATKGSKVMQLKDSKGKLYDRVKDNDAKYPDTHAFFPANLESGVTAV